MYSSTHPQGVYEGNYYTLYCILSSGPSFGYDSYNGYVDISIASNSNANQRSSSNFGYSFKNQNYPAGSARAKAILAGSYNFQTIEIEVFTIKDKYQIIDSL